MTLLFLSPHFPDHMSLFAAAAKSLGERVVGIGDAPPSALDPRTRAALDDYEGIPTLEDYDRVHRAAAALIARGGRLDAVESLNEHWLELEARLRLDFNVAGPRPRDVARHQSKLEMAAAFERHGLAVPTTLAIDPDDARADVFEALGPRLIVKPDRGVGASHTAAIATSEELRAALAGAGTRKMVAQPYVEGTLTSYDGLVDPDGEVVSESSFIYADGVLELVRDQQDVLYYTRREIPQPLREVGRSMVRALDLRGRFFHAELFELADGSFVPLELNVRPPGGFSCHLINFSADMDVFSDWARARVGAPVERKERRYHTAHVARRPGVRYVHDHEAVLRELGPALMLSAELPWIFAQAMGSPVYVVRHAEEAALLALSRFVCLRA